MGRDNRNLALLLGGQFISQIGDKFYALALAFWVLQATGSPQRMGIVLFAAMAPSILLGFVLGGVLDRWNRKAILITADLVRSAVIATITALFYWGALNLPIILAAQVVLSAASAFYNPTVSALVPQIVAQDRLGKANALSQLLSGIANILGPALGGLAVAGLGYGFVFVFNGASFLFSAALAAFLALPARTQPVQRAALPALAAIYRFIWRDKRILTILGVVAVIHFFVGSISVATPVLANALRGDGAANLGYLETALGMGTVLCALIMHRVNLNRREPRFLFGGIGGIGVVLCAAGALSLAGVAQLPLYLPIYLALSGAIIVVATAYTVLLQKTATGDVAAGVFSVMSSVGNLSIPLATLVFGALLEHLSWGIVALGCGAVIAVIGLLLLALYTAGERRISLRKDLPNDL